MNTLEIAEKFKELWLIGDNDEAIRLFYRDANFNNGNGFLLTRDITGHHYIFSQQIGQPILLDDFYSAELSDAVVMEDYFCYQLQMSFSLQDIGKASIKETWVFKLEKGKIIKETCYKGHSSNSLNSMEI